MLQLLHKGRYGLFLLRFEILGVVGDNYARHHRGGQYADEGDYDRDDPAEHSHRNDIAEADSGRGDEAKVYPFKHPVYLRFYKAYDYSAYAQDEKIEKEDAYGSRML